LYQHKPHIALQFTISKGSWNCQAGSRLQNKVQVKVVGDHLWLKHAKPPAWHIYYLKTNRSTIHTLQWNDRGDIQHATVDISHIQLDLAANSIKDVPTDTAPVLLQAHSHDRRKKEYYLIAFAA